MFLRLRERIAGFWLIRTRHRERPRFVPWVPGFPEEREDDYEMSYLRRREAGAVSKTPATDRVMPEDRQAYPALLEFLTATSWPDGTERRPGTMLFFVDEGRLKVCLSDRHQEQVLFVSVSGLFVALEVIDDALRAEDADWRPARKERSRR